VQVHKRLCGSVDSGIIGRMTPLFIRELTEEEHRALQVGLHSPHSFTLRRCQIVLASARGQTATAIAEQLGCATQTVRNALRAFERRGAASLSAQSRRPKRIARAWDTDQDERLRALLHHSPRAFGKDRSTWTLSLAVEVCVEQGLTSQAVSTETVRRALARLQVGWRRAKDWITSPDPLYALKKNSATG
jgi:transposase